MDLGAIWDVIILNPMINILVVLSKVLFNNLGLTIIALTIIIRGATYPLNRKQLLASKKMQELQPKIAELQKKYAKDRQKMAKEQMALFKEAGVSPTGCLLPMLTQMPIWLALYQSIVRVLATGPEQLLTLSRHLYASWPVVFDQIPLASRFLWFDLGVFDPTYILPLLVGASMWIQQKMVTPPNPDPQQQANSTMMLWMMPVMFTFFSLTFPSGLALYWVTSNIISIVMQYFVSGWGPLADTFKFLKKKGGPPTTPGVVDTQIVKKDAQQTTEKRKQSWMFWK
ncbi:MAG: YidC/Oxa1 family membrane protein insertase [Dehalococcoidales bacterium]|nr:YidC/Oxa1 family membrane protein insertase [Dehalococcoidales bacterium]